MLNEAGCRDPLEPLRHARLDDQGEGEGYSRG